MGQSEGTGDIADSAIPLVSPRGAKAHRWHRDLSRRPSRPFFVAAPLLGWPSVVRVSAVLGPALILGIAIARPWQDGRLESLSSWTPSRKVLIWRGRRARIVSVLDGAHALSQGEINAVDFTVYFDRPSFQTVHGRPLFVETAEALSF